MASGPLILAFSGGIGSGKSTLSSGVAEALEWPRVSFGRYVRAVALDRGLDAESREVLQEVGESLITAGWVPFCRAVLTQADWRPERSLVVDGIRHVEALQTLRALAAPSVYSGPLCQHREKGVSKVGESPFPVVVGVTLRPFSAPQRTR